MHEIEALEARLKDESIEYCISKKMDSRGIQGCLEKIDEADVVYVVNPGGYVGKSVCVDIGYAYARDKPIYVLCSVDDPPMMKLIQGILSFEELIELLKRSDLL